jgi:ABC-2 type transport system ATP-binding protein
MGQLLITTLVQDQAGARAGESGARLGPLSRKMAPQSPQRLYNVCGSRGPPRDGLWWTNNQRVVLNAGIELRVVAGPDAGRSVPVGGEVVLGRDTTLEHPLGDVEVSRRHARIRLERGRLQVEDLGSTNGTFVNGERIADPLDLRSGDRITLGDTVLELIWPDGSTRISDAPPVDRETVLRQRPVAPAPPTPPPNSIEVEALVREFPGKGRAVDGLTLRVEPGEIYGFLGPNGAGKSTTVHMLVTLLPPSGGTARVAGYDVARESGRVRESIGVALQEAALDPLLNAFEHMRLQCAMQALPRREWDVRSRELIERVKLTEAAPRRAETYSGGMKRRLDLALALVHRPRVLFLDEPTTGLDPQSRADLWQEVVRLAKDEGVTVFLTTQYLDEADVLADRIGIIDHGRLVAQGTPERLKAEIGRPTAEFIPEEPGERGRLAAMLKQFGSPATSAQGAAVRLEQGAKQLADIIRALDGEGIRLASVQMHEPTLDDVFLKQTGRSLAQEVVAVSGVMEVPPLPPDLAQRR